MRQRVDYRGVDGKNRVLSAGLDAEDWCDLAFSEAMLPRQPLRFLLADDPGAGKTIMAGLLMKELIARGDLQRCLVVCPGSLAAIQSSAAAKMAA
jgi:hypothetical protein